MKEISYTIKFREMFSEFYKSGGCLEIKVFEPEQRIKSKRKKLHFFAAVKAIHNELLEKNNQEHFFKSGKKVKESVFWGDLVDVKKRRLILRGKNENWYNFYYHDNGEEILRPKLCGGLGYAFFETPHTLRLKDSIKDEGDFFFEFFNELFGDLNQIEVYEWSTDFSSYFDAGKEWWGEFYWTVYSFEKELFIAITASTSD